MDKSDCDVVQSSQEVSDKIKPIGRDTVHKICSGQVVLSLAIAVKELVENAVDANATIINIYLKEYGADLIEVSDNGVGIAKDNFQLLTLKHYTSKLRQFDDLANITTLGFRGEALSSLCALSNLSIITKHQTAEHAMKIIYDHNGKIIDEQLTTREQGTTVILENLFFSLPVRRKEFQKNLKREFNKLCQFLYAYCLVSKGIKFTVTNVTNKGSRNTVVSTEGSNKVQENIISVFGTKQIASLIEVECVRPTESVLAEYGITLAEGEVSPFSFECLISSVMHGNGRSTNDRQFYFINSRPCEPTKIMKLVNEIYKQYNSSQYPFVYLNILSKSSLVDVNVTPDKRQVFLEKEKVLLATIKSSLIEAFKSFPSTFKMQNLEASQCLDKNSFFTNSNNQQSKGIKRNITDSSISKGSILKKFGKKCKTENDRNCSPISTFFKDLSNSNINQDSDEKLDTFIEIAKKIVEQERNPKEGIEENEIVSENSKTEENMSTRIEEIKMRCPNPETKANILIDPDNKEIRSPATKPDGSKTKVESLTVINDKSKGAETPKKFSPEKVKSEAIKENIKTVSENMEFSIDTSVKRSPTKNVTLDLSMENIRESLKHKRNQKDKETNVKVHFRSTIAPENNKSAEQELRKHISKADFKEMSIIGQFNLAFVITKLHNDLFIIDQHAADEKYNFEQLQASTVLESQILVNPKPLELTAGNECLLIDNEEIFKSNGFTFKIDHSAPCTKKVALTAIPLSNNFILGKDDIEEMLFMLKDSSNKMCRPSRIRAMFASRACRKSIMIGKALSKSDMRKLVDHMSEIDQPWNCPHGRPVMRHLINLNLIHEN